MHRTASITGLFLLMLAVLLPAAATAAEPEPQAIDDPPAAVAPTPQAEPIPEAAVAPEPEVRAEAVVDSAESTAAGGSSAISTSAVVPTTTAPTSGSLPFTGTDPRQLVLLLVVGSLLFLGGITARAYAQASTLGP